MTPSAQLRAAESVALREPEGEASRPGRWSRAAREGWEGYEERRFPKQKRLMKTIEERIIEIAKLWKGHEGVNYETTTVADLLTLIEDAVKYDQKRLREEEMGLLQAIAERDDAEEALNRAYRLVTGRSPEWSNNFGYEDAINEINERIAGLRSVTRV